MSYWLHPEAEIELGDAAVYYSEHASRRVAEAFLAEFERVRNLLIENQYRGPHGDFGLRIFHFDRFPYTRAYTNHTISWVRKSTPSLTNTESQVTGPRASAHDQRE